MNHLLSKVYRYSLLSCVFVVSLALLVQSVKGAGSASTLPGQQPGTPVGSFQLSGLDTVNLFNGHLNFRLPLLNVGGRGEASFSLGLPIDHRWFLLPTSPDTPDTFFPAFLSFTSLTPGYMRARHLSVGCQYGVNFWTDTQTILTFTTSNGTEIEFRDSNFVGQQTLSQCNQFDPGAGMANRGRSFFTLDHSFTFVSDTDIFDMTQATNPTETRPSGYLLTNDGARYRISDGQVQWLRERNGNLLTFTYASPTRLTGVTDSLNRQIIISYVNVDVTRFHTNITYKGFGGAPRTINIEYGDLSELLIEGTTATRQELFGIGGFGTDEEFNPWLVKLVRLPDNQSLQMRYTKYGELARVELPTGGVFTYQWASGNPQNANGLSGKFVDRRVVKKSIYKDPATLVGSTSFGLFETHPSGTSGSAKLRQLDESDNPISDERHYFHGIPMDHTNYGFGHLADPMIGREYQTDINTANGATLLRRVAHTFDVFGINIKETVTTLADVLPHLVSKRTFTYDSFFNLTDTYEYDFDQTLERRIHTDYVTNSTYTGTDLMAVYAGSAAHLRSLPLQKWISSDLDGLNKKSLTTFEYDNYSVDTLHAPLTPRSNISGLCTTFNAAGVCSNTNPTSYTTRGNVTKVTSYANASAVSGAVTGALQYDIAGNVVKRIDARGFATLFGFADCYGSPDANAQNCGGAAELGSQVSYAFPTTVTNALNQISRMQFDYYLGRPVETGDVNGVVTSVHYNDLLDRVRRVIRADNQSSSASVRGQTTIDYDDANRKITITDDFNIFDDKAIVSSSFYDGLGRATETRRHEGGTNYLVTRVEYDALGRAFKTSNPFRPWKSETPIWTTSAFDELGRVSSVITPDGATVSISYLGNVTTSTDQAGKKRKSVTDALGRLVQVYEAPNDSTYNHLTNYSYDILDDLTTVNQGSQTRTLVYDSLKRLKSATDPESGTMDFDYDENSNLIKKVDSRFLPGTSTRILTTSAYDGLNRVTSRTYNDGTPNVTYAYDAPNVAFSKGRLTGVSSTVSSYTFGEFDALGRIKSGTQTTSGQAYVMGYQYDLVGNLISQTYPSGRVVRTDYDEAGRIAGVKNNQTGNYYVGAVSTDVANRIQYSAAGDVKTMKLGNGLWEHTNFNSRLQPTQIGLGSAATNSTLVQLDYDFGTVNNNGNLLGQTITVPTVGGVAGFTATQTYGYDPLNRLATAQENGGSSWRQNFSYDRYGNRKLSAGTTLPSAFTTENNPTINANNNRIDNTVSGQTNVLYDNAGNLTRDVAGHIYQYDAENRMIAYDGGAAATGGATYSYDGNGQRVKKVVGGSTLLITMFVYDIQGQLIAEYADSAPNGGGTSYVTSDTLGSPRVITGSSQQVKGRHDYLPFGEELSAGTSGRTPQHSYGADNLRQKFTSYERDDETGLDFASARYYASRQGRFTTVDPLMASKTLMNPQTFNRYSYVVNNPLILIDPSGMVAEDALGGCKSMGGGPCWKNPNDKESIHQDKDKDIVKPPKDLFKQLTDPNVLLLTVFHYKITDEMVKDLAEDVEFFYNRGFEEKQLFSQASEEIAANNKIIKENYHSSVWSLYGLLPEPYIVMPSPEDVGKPIRIEGSVGFTRVHSTPVAAEQWTATVSYAAVARYNAYVAETDRLLARRRENFIQKYSGTTVTTPSGKPRIVGKMGAAMIYDQRIWTARRAGWRK